MKQEIRNDLKNGKSIDDVCKDYNISFKDLMELMSEPEYLRKKKMLPEQIILKNHMYTICNIIKGKIVYFGSFRTLHQAKEVLKRLEESNWSLRPRQYLGMSYIYSRNTGYQVKKNYGNGHSWSRVFENKEDAIFVRDELVLCDWDLSCLPEILEKMECEGSGDYC